MKSWPTLLLAILVLGLMTYIYLDVKDAPTTGEIEERGKKAVDFKEDDIDRIELKNSTGTFVFNRTGDRWNLETPIAFPAETFTVTRMLGMLSNARKLAVLRDIPMDQALDRFKLKEPRVEATFKSPQRAFTIAFGKSTAAAGGVYTLVTQGKKREVIVLADDLLTLLDTGLDNWRSHSVVDLTLSTVDGIVLHQDQTEVEVRKKDGKWQILKPLAAPADEASVQKFLQDLSNFRAVKFVSETDALSPAFGLSAPPVLLELHQGEKVSRLRVGQPSKEDSNLWNASFEPRTTVFTLTAPNVETIMNLLDRVRDRRIVGFEMSTDVTRLKIKRGTQEIEIKRDPENPTAWLLQPDGMAVDIRPVEDYLTRMVSTRVARFPTVAEAQSYNAAKAVATVEVAWKTPTPESTKKGEAVSDKSDKAKKEPEETVETFVLSPWQKPVPVAGSKDKTPDVPPNTFVFLTAPKFSGPVIIPGYLLTLLPERPWQWLPLRIFRSDLKPITALSWKLGNSPEVGIVQRENVGWVPATGGGQVDKALLETMLNAVSDLTAVRWVGLVGKDDFKNPALTLTLTRGDQKDILEFGPFSGDKTIEARLNKQAWAFLLPERDFLLFKNTPIRPVIAEEKKPASAKPAPVPVR